MRISNDSLNSYGTRVLTAGMDVEQYMRNPVLLYMHERGSVIGYVKDIRIENDEVTGELVFDEVTELSKRCKRSITELWRMEWKKAMSLSGKAALT